MKTLYHVKLVDPLATWKEEKYYHSSYEDVHEFLSEMLDDIIKIAKREIDPKNIPIFTARYDEVEAEYLLKHTKALIEDLKDVIAKKGVNEVPKEPFNNGDVFPDDDDDDDENDEDEEVCDDDHVSTKEE